MDVSALLCTLLCGVAVARRGGSARRRTLLCGVAVSSGSAERPARPHPASAPCTPAGIQTATDAFSAADLLYINSLFSLQTVVRQVGGSPPYYCTASECQAAKPCWVLGAVDGGQRGGRRAGAMQCPRSAGG